MPDVRIIPASGSLQFTGSSAADSIHVQYTNSGLGFTAGSTRMFISSSGRVGINTAIPSYGLHVVGTAAVSSTLTLGDTIVRGGSGLTTFLQNTNGERMFTYGQSGGLGDYIAIGRVSGHASATQRNTIIGSAAGNGLTSGVANTLIGYGAMNGANTSYNTCIGDLAGQNLSGGGNTIIGASNFSGGSLGGSSIGIGYNNSSNTGYTLPTNTIVLGNSNYLATSSFVTNSTFIGNSLSNTLTTLSNVVVLGKSTQNVLIGEPSADAGYKLDVNGSARSTAFRLTNNSFIVNTYTPGATILQISNSSIGTHNGATGISITCSVGIIAYSNLGINGSNPVGASIYAAGGSASGNISLGIISNRALITSTANGLAMHTSSMLQVDSTTQGFLPPRTHLTSNIDTPAQGLITYVTGSGNGGDGLYYYNSGSSIGWHKVLTNSGSQSISGSLTITGTITGSITTAATASKIISNGGLNGGNHYFYISTYPPAGGNVGVIQTSNLIYNSSTNTLPTTSSWATSSMSSSYVNTLVQGVVITGSLNVTAGITGSLLGTASYATQALSASWAPGGGGSSFPYTGSAQITGSLVVTGDINVTGYSGFGTNTPTVRVEIDAADNGLQRALKIRNTNSGSTAAAIMDFKTTDNDEFSIGQFNGAIGGVYNAGDVFLQNNSTTGGLSNMYIGNAGNANRMVISHTNTVGIGFPIGSVSSTMFSVSGSADIINNLSVGSNGGSLLLENGAGQTGKDSAGNIILNFDGATNPTLLMGPNSGINLLVTNTIGGITEIIDQDTLEVDYLGSPSAQGSILSRAESGEAFDTGQLLFLSSSNQWYIADATAAATSTPLLGIALKDAGAANDLIAVLLEGHYSTDAYHDQVATPATPGSPLYISTTAGNVTETAPTGTGDVVRLIGHNIYGGAGGRGPDVAVIRFKPDNTWIEL